jgi:hypothetical protein
MENQVIDERIKKAYETYMEKKDQNIDSLALSTLNDLHNQIADWVGNVDKLSGINFYRKYLTGRHMDAIAARGAATATIENFESIMGKVVTVKKIAKLFMIRRDHELQSGIVNKIAEVDFITAVINHPTQEGAKPLLYTHRFLLSCFIEIMTTIADRNHLEDTAILIGIGKPKTVSFERLQVQVREIVEDSLIRQDIGNELTKFSRATIAYHIKDACE